MSLIHRRIIRGDPIRVGEKEIVPEAQVTWWMKRSAVVGNGVEGQGACVVNIQPCALIEQGPEGERRIPILDKTLPMMLGLAAGAVLIWFLAEIAIRLATLRGGEK